MRYAGGEDPNQFIQANDFRPANPVADATITFPKQTLVADGTSVAYPLTGFTGALLGSFQVSLSGQWQAEGVFTISGPYVLTFDSPPPAGATIYVEAIATDVVTQLNGLMASLRKSRTLRR
jgi:hypothetical protein